MEELHLEELLKYSEKESKMFVPNEVFDILKGNISKSPHISFAYSYLYLCTWLYRYAKHFNAGIFDNKKIKEVLGYSATNQSLDYLIKKGGLLDKIECTESTRDYPIRWNYKSDDRELAFEMSSDYKDFSEYMPIVPKRFFLKYPVKGFYRIEVDVYGVESEYQGTFYDVSNTHEIPFEVFLYCMSNKEIGCAGFYLYSYIKQKSDHFKEGYNISLENLSKDTRVPIRTLNRYMDILKGYRMIDFSHNQEYFVVGWSSKERMANTYTARDYNFFEVSKRPYHKIGVISEGRYNRIKEEGEDSVKNIEEQLPF